MGNKKLQYQAVSKNFFVPATVVATAFGPFTAFSQPQRITNPALNVDAVANVTAMPVKAVGVFSQFGTVQPRNAALQAAVSRVFPFTTVPQVQTPALFSRFPDPKPPPNQGLQPQATDAFPFTPSPVQPTTALFSKFSAPLSKPFIGASNLDTPFQVPQVYIEFSKFSVPPPKPFLFAVQPSGLFTQRLPDPSTSGPVFATFSLPQRFPVNITLLTTFKTFPFNPPPNPTPVFVIDTHDWVKKKRRKRPDISEEVSRRKKLREDIEKAVYGDDVGLNDIETDIDIILPQVLAVPEIDHSELIRAMVKLQQRQVAQKLEDHQAEEEDLNFILRNL